jgi:hypothetical protein
MGERWIWCCPDGKIMAYPLSLRHIEEMMRERGVFDDHATVYLWAIKMVPVLAAEPEGRVDQALADWLSGHTDYLDSALAQWMVKKQLGAIPAVVRKNLQFDQTVPLALAPKGAKTY